MDNWLVGFSQDEPTDGELLYKSLEQFSVSELQKLAFDVDPLSRLTHVDDLRGKLFDADRHGRELAHENQVLEKIAFLPAIAAGAARLAPLAGKAAGALGGAKGIVGGVARDMAISGAASKVMGALKPAAPAASAAGEIAGGFKYAFAGGLLQQAAGYVTKHPGTALTAAGAVGGAMMAPRDPQTGQKQYLKGALIGGVGTAGANALSNGAIANKMRSSVLNRESPLLGQGTRRYLMDSAAATQGKSPISSSLRSRQMQYGKVAPNATQGTSPTTPPTGTVAVPPPPTQSADWAAAHQGVQNMRERAGWDVMHAVGMDPRTQMPIQSSPPPIPGKGPGYSGGPSMGAIKLANFKKQALVGADDVIGGLVGYSSGKRQASRGEGHTFGVPQVGSLLLPGGFGYQVGRAFGHSKAREKKANQQTLTYDPATKTFTRQHLTPSQGSGDLKAMGASPIPAGHREPVRSVAGAAGPARRPMAFAARAM